MLFDETFDYLSRDITLKILEILKNLKNDNTILVITKNKTIIEADYVDQVILLQDNKVVATGTHENLLKDDAVYKKILKKL